MTWSVYASCTLCRERTPSFSHVDDKVAAGQADASALELGFVTYPAAHERGRSAGVLCPACVADLRPLISSATTETPTP